MTPSLFVYFIQEGADGPIKIGVATDPARRLKGVQNGNPRPLRIVGYFPGDYKLEYELHKKFAEWRLEGEWFAPEAPGLSEAARLASFVQRSIESDIDTIQGPLIDRLIVDLGLEQFVKVAA